MNANVIIRSYRKEREKEIMDGLQKSMEKIGQIVERQAKINVTKSPPEHPQVQTGRLRSSIIHQVTSNPNEIVAEIGTNVTYGRILEFGSSRMQPYPWLFPACESTKPQIVEAIKSGGGKLKEVEVVGGIWKK